MQSASKDTFSDSSSDDDEFIEEGIMQGYFTDRTINSNIKPRSNASLSVLSPLPLIKIIENLML